MKLDPQIALSFDGRCEAAFRHYAACLDATIAFMATWRESPAAADAPPGWAAKIYHATLKIGETAIMGSDPLPHQFEAPKGFSIALQMDDPAAAERIFHALAEGGRVEVPLQQTHWAARFGVLVDRFGIPWAINCEKPV